MTEAEWLANGVEQRERATEALDPRRGRLLAIAACRSLTAVVGLPEVAHALDVAERYADTGLTKGTLRRARQAVARVRELANEVNDPLASMLWVVESAAMVRGFTQTLGIVVVTRERYCGSERSAVDRELFQQYAEIAGPADFRFELAWRTPTTTAIATGAYAERAFDRLLILADALEDAGCDAAELLAHLRGPSPHARGCWALDAVLGKT